MLNPLTWLQNKMAPIPHADELQGKTLREMERALRAKGGRRRLASSAPLQDEPPAP